MPTEIRGGQIKDDTITGADIDESTLIISSIKDTDNNTKIQCEESAGEDKIRFDTAGYERMVIDTSGQVGIGTQNPSQLLTINGADDSAQPAMQFQEGGADRAKVFINSSNNLEIKQQFANKHIVFKVLDAGVTREAFRMDGAVPEVVVNQTGDSLVDFRVESDNNTHMLFIDGGNDTVGIGTGAPGSGLTVAKSVSFPVGALRTSAYTITADDFCIVADCNSSSFTLTLPPATDAMAGRIYTIKRMDSGNNGGSNMLTVSRNGKNIDNIAEDVILANLDALILQCIGATGGWIRIGSFLAPL